MASFKTGAFAACEGRASRQVSQVDVALHDSKSASATIGTTPGRHHAILVAERTRHVQLVGAVRFMRRPRQAAPPARLAKRLCGHASRPVRKPAPGRWRAQDVVVAPVQAAPPGRPRQAGGRRQRTPCRASSAHIRSRQPPGRISVRRPSDTNVLRYHVAAPVVPGKRVPREGVRKALRSLRGSTPRAVSRARQTVLHHRPDSAKIHLPGVFHLERGHDLAHVAD